MNIVYPLKNLPKYVILLFFTCCFAGNASAQLVAVTFQVDVRNEQLNGESVFVVINGFYNNIPQLMSDSDGDNIWTLTQFFPSGQLQYRFTIDQNLESSNFLGDCGSFVPPNNEFYRISSIPSTTPFELPLACFGFCGPCGIGLVGEPTFVDACLGEPLSICVTDPSITSQNYLYQWYRTDNNTPITSSSADPCFQIPQVMLNTPLSYYCEIQDLSEDVLFLHRPFTLTLLEEDAIGGKYHANQFLIQFIPGLSQSQRDQVREQYEAIRLDSCMCEWELWKMPDVVEYPPGSGNFIIDDEEKKTTAKDEPEVEEVDYNYQIEEYALPNDDHFYPQEQSFVTSFLDNNEINDFLPCTTLGFNGNQTQVTTQNRPLNSIGNGDFTFEAWIKGNAAVQASDPVIFSNRANATNGCMFFLTDYLGSPHKVLALQFRGTNYLDITAPDVLDDDCHHLAITRQGNQLQYYIDGYLSNTITFTGNPTISTNQDLLIGIDPFSPNTTSFNGLIEEVRIWDIARSSTEILKTAKIRLYGDEPNLLAYWNFKEGTGQMLSDLTGNGFDGYLGTSVAPDNFEPQWLSSCCFNSPILTAIIDGGIQYDHPYLSSKIWLNPSEDPNAMDDDNNCAVDDIIGYNYANNNNNPIDLVKGHGTHVAGLPIQSAEGGFNVPEANVVQLLNLKNIKDSGKGDLFDATCAVLHAADKKAKIINCSWGYYGLPSAILYQAFETAAENCGALVITSAGNSAQDVSIEPHYPGNYNEAFLNMIQTGAVDTIKMKTYSYECSVLDFDGDNDVVTIGDPVLTTAEIATDFTLEAWIQGNLSEQAAHPLIFSNRPSSQEGLAFYFKDNRMTPVQKLLALQIGDTEYVDPSFPNAFDGNCHHVAIVKTGNKLRFYYDGVLSNEIVMEPFTLTTVSATSWIGLDPLSPTNFIFDGWIEEVRIWRSAFSAAQIQEAFNNSIALSSGLLAYWKMNNDHPQEIYDISASGFDGFLGSSTSPEASDPLWLMDCCVTDSTLISSSMSLEIAPYSNYSNQLVDIAVTGLQHSSLPIDTEGWKAGTSMSAAYLSGIAARLFYENPAAEWPEVKQCILDNASTLPALSDKVNNQRYFDRPIDLEACIDCIRNIDPDQTDCTYLLSPLPLSLLELEGHWQKDHIQLQWTILSHQDISKFEVERLNPQSKWKKLLEKTPLIQSNATQKGYQALDTAPLEGENFYRVKVLYEAGKTEWSNIIRVETPHKNNSFVLFPNPSQNFINLELFFETAVSVDIYNATGIKLKSFEFQANKPKQRIDVKDLPNGLYLLVLETQEGIIGQQKFVKD